MEIASNWLLTIGGFLLGSLAVGMWYGGGNKTTSIWIGFAGVICFLLVVALQMQAHVWRQTPDDDTKQPRANVGLDAIIPPNIDAEVLDFRLVFKNFGQIPALDMVHRAAGRFDTYPVPARPLLKPEEVPTFVKGTLVGGDAYSTIITFNKLTDAEKQAIRAGTKRFYIYGMLTYKNTLSDTRHLTTRFRGVFGGPESLRLNVLLFEAEGNERD